MIFKQKKTHVFQLISHRFNKFKRTKTNNNNITKCVKWDRRSTTKAIDRWIYDVQVTSSQVKIHQTPNSKIVLIYEHITILHNIFKATVLFCSLCLVFWWFPKQGFFDVRTHAKFKSNEINHENYWCGNVCPLDYVPKKKM